MGSRPITPDDIDTNTPSACRMYDYYLGGSHNFPADRAAAERVLTTAPWTREMALSNRAFLRRAVTYLAGGCGVRQFLELGSGVPTVGNVHEVAQSVDGRCRVVYVDKDPVAIAHSKMILATNAQCAVVPEDIRGPALVQRHPDLLALLDFARPVGLLMVSILPFITDEERPAELVAAYVNDLAPGSYLAISHASLDGCDAELRSKVEHAAQVYAKAGQPVTLRSCAEIRSWFDGLRLVEPGVVPLPDWRPDPGAEPGFYGMLSFGGVGRVVS